MHASWSTSLKGPQQTKGSCGFYTSLEEWGSWFGQMEATELEEEEYGWARECPEP